MKLECLSSQNSFKTFFVHRHLYCHVRKGAINDLVRPGFNGRIIFGVGMEMSNWADAKIYVSAY